jgi:hypothetical protein
MWFIGKLLSMIDDLAYTYDSVWITFPPQAGPRNDHQRVPEVVSNSMLVCLMLLDAVAATFLEVVRQPRSSQARQSGGLSQFRMTGLSVGAQAPESGRKARR